MTQTKLLVSIKMKKKKPVNKNTKAYAKKLEKRELKRLDEEWKTKVKEEWGHQCAFCGRKDLIHCHHLLPRELKLLRHNVLNSIVLCPKCHKYAIETPSAHKNSFAFYHWYFNNYSYKSEELINLYYRLYPKKNKF